MVGSAGRQSGFTLLELLVAMLLLGLLSGLLYGGLQFGTRVWEKGNDELQQLEELQTAQRFFRRQLSRAIPYAFDGAGAQSPVAFVGTRTSLWFIGPSPSQSLMGGLYQYRLDMDNVAGKNRIVLTFALLNKDAGLNGQINDGDSVAIMDNIGELEFAYFGSDRPNFAPRWLDEWRDQTVMPSLVRVAVRFSSSDKRIWPEVIVKPAVNLGSL